MLFTVSYRTPGPQNNFLSSLLTGRFNIEDALTQTGVFAKRFVPNRLSSTWASLGKQSRMFLTLHDLTLRGCTSTRTFNRSVLYVFLSSFCV